ncbi:mdm2-binding protein isoform X2 [Osmerus eperlanus]|uniref:mdm2-binding protein isoform X2 n=1 Tax=Osmerus eperlanus TaxID=29151 RepID=UPI002E13F59C
MDRYVLVVSFNQEDNKCSDGFRPLDVAKQIYNKLGDISSRHSKRKVSPIPACSLSGVPACQKWYFGIQVCQGTSQYCSVEWEELGAGLQKSDSEEESPSALEACLSALADQEEPSNQADMPPLTELYEEAAEGLHLLSDKLPPPGKALLDVILLQVDKEPPGLRDVLPVMGALKQMQAWHSGKVTIVTEHTVGWQKSASYLSASLMDPSAVETCIDENELWRGGLLIREKKGVAELRFQGFSLRCGNGQAWSSLMTSDLEAQNNTDLKLHPEVYQYYRPVLDLVQMVTLSDLPSFLRSSTEFELRLSSKSVKAKLLLDQLRPLCGKVGALFSLSCVVSSMVQPPASQLSSLRWKEFVAQGPKTLPVPDVEVKGETAHYFLLVQGSEAGACRARMIHSANQINGAAAMATIHGLLREKSLSSSGEVADWLRPLPRLTGDQLLERERSVMKMQTLVLKECLRRRLAGSQTPGTVPVNDLRALLSLAREQYLQIHQPGPPSAAPCLPEEQQNQANPSTTATKTSESRQRSKTSDWPERSVLKNLENLQSRRQKRRFGLLSGPGSSDSLLGPKDSPRVASATLDARELLRHFTPDGLPTGELQPLQLLRGQGGNAFQLSPDLTPRKVTQLSFSKAASSHYHGIEFCLDKHKALERDWLMVKLQSRLIRYETQTTCTREPCPLAFALSPAPSPAVLSEPGSVPDGESLLLQNADVSRLKRRSWDTDPAGYPRKRLVKSESSECLGSQGSSSNTHRAVRALRQQPIRTQSSSSSSSSPASRRAPLPDPPPGPPCPRQARQPPQGGAGDQTSKESRSQKHIRMLREVVAKTLNQHGITGQHEHFSACSQRLFEISKFYLKDLKTSRGLHEEMKKAACSNAKQVIDWVVEKASKK